MGQISSVGGEVFVVRIRRIFIVSMALAGHSGWVMPEDATISLICVTHLIILCHHVFLALQFPSLSWSSYFLPVLYLKKSLSVYSYHNKFYYLQYPFWPLRLIRIIEFHCCQIEAEVLSIWSVCWFTSLYSNSGLPVCLYAFIVFISTALNSFTCICAMFSYEEQVYSLRTMAEWVGQVEATMIECYFKKTYLYLFVFILLPRDKILFFEWERIGSS